MLKILFTMLCTFFAIAAFRLGFEWQYLGHGLNPMAAYPVGTFLLIVPYLMHHLLRRTRCTSHNHHYLSKTS